MDAKSAFDITNSEIENWNKNPKKRLSQISKSDLDHPINDRQINSSFSRLDQEHEKASLQSLLTINLTWTKLEEYLPSLANLTHTLHYGSERSLLSTAIDNGYSNLYNFLKHVKNHCADDIQSELNNNDQIVSFHIDDGTDSDVLPEEYFEFGERFDNNKWNKMVSKSSTCYTEQKSYKISKSASPSSLFANPTENDNDFQVEPTTGKVIRQQ